MNSTTDNNWKYNLIVAIVGVGVLMTIVATGTLYYFMLTNAALVAVFVVIMFGLLLAGAFMFYAMARQQPIVPAALKAEPYQVITPAQLSAPARDAFVPFVAQPRRARANTVTFRLSDGSDVVVKSDVLAAFCDLPAPSRAQWREHVGGSNDDLAALRRVGTDRGYIISGAWADAGAGERMSQEVREWQN